MAKKSNKQPPKLKVYQQSFGEGTITIQEHEPNSARWQLVDFQGFNLRKLSKALYKVLKNKPECYTLYAGNARLTQALTKDEILQELADTISENELRNIFLS